MDPACPTQIHTTQVVWDTLGRKLQIQDPDAGQWTYEYFDSGLLKKQTNGSGKSLEWSYDALERMIQQTVTPTGNGSASASFAHGTTPGPDYGLLVSVTASRNYAYARDAAGRLASLTQSTPTTTGGFHGVRTWSYDELDRVSGYVFPGGTSVQNLYDGLRLVRIEQQSWVPLAQATYDALGRPGDLDLGSSVSGSPTPRATLDYEYTDPGARLSRILARRQPDAGAQTVMDLAYEFDGLGRLTDQDGSFNGQNVDRSFGYDGLGRLTQATGPWQTSPPGTNIAWSFTYDPLGNLRTLSGSSYTRTWSYAHASKPRFLSRFTESTDPIAEDMQPDAGGNLAEVNRAGAITSYVWNAQNRLRSGAGGTLSYDAFARRVELHHTGSSETSVVFVGDDFEYNTTLNQANLHFFVGGQRIASYATYPLFLEVGSTWGWLGERVAPPLAGFTVLVGLVGLAALTRRRRVPAWLGASGVGLLGAGLVLLPIPASAVGSGTPYPLGSHGEQGGVFYLTDHLGSTRAVVNLNGSQLESFDYDPFGRTFAHTGEMNLKHRFTGQPIHEPQYAATDPLYNYGARFYQPKWGRFVSADTFLEGLSSQGMNRYAYVGNRPTWRVDPTGHASASPAVLKSQLAQARAERSQLESEDAALEAEERAVASELRTDAAWEIAQDMGEFAAEKAAEESPRFRRGAPTLRWLGRLSTAWEVGKFLAKLTHLADIAVRRREIADLLPGIEEQIEELESHLRFLNARDAALKSREGERDRGWGGRPRGGSDGGAGGGYEEDAVPGGGSGSINFPSPSLPLGVPFLFML